MLEVCIKIKVQEQLGRAGHRALFSSAEMACFLICVTELQQFDMRAGQPCLAVLRAASLHLKCCITASSPLWARVFPVKVTSVEWENAALIYLDCIGSVWKLLA